MESLTSRQRPARGRAVEDVRDTWRTPWWLVRLLEARLGGGFDLDAAADEVNHKAPRYFTRGQNGLDMPWVGERVFCNPPFRLIGEFVTHGLRALRRGEIEHGLGLVTLADVSTRYWAALEDAGAQRVRIRGRWGCEAPPGITGESTPTRPMTAWVVERPLTVARAKRLYGGPHG